MTKLITRYQDAPTIENARRIFNYTRKHGMWACMRTREEIEIVRGAIVQLENA